MTDMRTRTLLGWLGRIVTVQIEDATTSPKKGYVRGSESEQNRAAYVMGAAHVGQTYTGKVISVLRRYAEGEDKLIVAPVGKEMYEPWIRAELGDEGGAEHTRLFCLYEKSCGVIPWRVRNGRLEYLALFQSGSSTWSFPKGHMELGEDEVATARREVQEEIGVTLEIPTDFRCEISYRVHNGHSKKKVVLFAVPFDGEVTLREGEIGDARWLGRSEVQKLFGHRELRSIFNRLEKKVAEERRA